MAKHILITGGLGNLGSWLTEHFVNQDYKVTVLAKRKRLILQELDFDFISCDISDPEDCRQKLAGKSFDYVIHAASSNEYFIDNYPYHALMVNAYGTRNLLDALKDAGLKHFLYLSTFQVYGAYSGKITEETPTLSRNDYGVTHLFAESYVKQFHATSGIPYLIIRLTNSYGCPKDPDSSKWYLILNDLARMAVQEKKIVLRSNGKAPRDFIWMDTVCEVFEKLLEREEPFNDTFNIAGEKTHNMLQVAEFVQQAYEEVYGEKLEIQTNTEDKSTFDIPLEVSAAKLRKFVDYEVKDKFVEEAKKIFELVEKGNA